MHADKQDKTRRKKERKNSKSVIAELAKENCGGFVAGHPRYRGWKVHSRKNLVKRKKIAPALGNQPSEKKRHPPVGLRSETGENAGQNRK